MVLFPFTESGPEDHGSVCPRTPTQKDSEDPRPVSRPPFCPSGVGFVRPTSRVLTLVRETRLDRDGQ